ncbi:MAG: hypothetical protein V2A71_06270 [Candidatus Eisenbacteria bacterium]
MPKMTLGERAAYARGLADGFAKAARIVEATRARCEYEADHATKTSDATWWEGAFRNLLPISEVLYAKARKVKANAKAK